MGPGSATPTPNPKPHLGRVYCNAAALYRATEEHGGRTVQHEPQLVRVGVRVRDRLRDRDRFRVVAQFNMKPDWQGVRGWGWGWGCS